MDHAKLRSILERMTAVLTHLAGRHYGAPIRPQVEEIGADLKALKDDADAAGASLEDRIKSLETAVADLHAALSDKPSPAAVQKAVADVEVPQPNG